MDEFARLAYENSLRRLDDQGRRLSDLRTGTGLLLAASSLTASVLGRPAFEARPLTPALLAVAAFVASITASVYVLMPTRRLVLALAGSELYERLFAFRSDIAEVHHRLAYDLDRIWASNEREIESRIRGLQCAATALAAELVFLLLAVGVSLAEAMTTHSQAPPPPPPTPGIGSPERLAEDGLLQRFMRWLLGPRDKK